MAKTRTHHVCQKCGYESIRWLGRCPDCDSWNSMTEEVVADAPARASSFGLPTAAVPPRPITEIDLHDHQRLPSGIQEFDRVLGGGPVPGSVVLIGGDPGIGKCVTADTRVLDPCSGAYRPITDWATELSPVAAVDEGTLKLHAAAVRTFHERGIRSIVKVRTKLGRELRCTPDHPVLTPDGWRGVDTLSVGSRIASPRALPWFGSEPLPEAAVKLIAYILSDGSAQSAIGVTSELPEVALDLEEVAAAFQMRLVAYEKRGNRARQYRFTNPRDARGRQRQEFAAALWRVKATLDCSWQEWARRADVSYGHLNSWRRGQSVPSEAALARLADAARVPLAELAPDARSAADEKTPVARFLEQVGLRFRTAANKAVPDCVFRLPREQLALFLHVLFTCDGSVYRIGSGQPGLAYCTISRRLAEDVQHLLLRFGFVATLRTKESRVRGLLYFAYEVVVLGVGEVQRFLTTVGIMGRKTACTAIAAMTAPRGAPTHRDTIPTGPEFWARLRATSGGANFRTISGSAGVTLRNRRHDRPLCRRTVAAIADAYPDPHLHALAYGDVYWDEIASITPEGTASVYDLTVPGPANFVANDLIVHNSTLLTQVAARLADEHGSTLYVTGEESVQQVRMRADRLGTLSDRLLLAAETNLDIIEGYAEKLRPDYVVVDSIQTAHDPSLSSAPATVSQLRACCARMTRLAKTTNTTVFLVGHVTKEGAIAGPRVLEHMVDTVLYFEGDRFHTHRILRSVKNRFGSTDEIGIFVMRESGLMEVANASEWMLAQRPVARPGSAVVAVVEGTRPLLVEVQALVSRSFAQSPRRMATGLDFNRVCMILAVLDKRCGLRLSDKDVYVNVPGGIRVVEPAADLGIAVALASSYRDTPVDASLVVTGEIGLSGEVRAVQQTEKRLMEAQRLGFERALVARSPARLASVRLQVDPIDTLREALDHALTGPPETDAGDDEPSAEPEPNAE